MMTGRSWVSHRMVRMRAKKVGKLVGQVYGVEETKDSTDMSSALIVPRSEGGN
jgi:hypothetical protein